MTSSSIKLELKNHTMRIMNRHITHIILWAFAIIVMAACGGGGSDVPSPAPTPTPIPTPTNPTNPDPEPEPEPTPIPEPTPEPQQVPIGFRADLSDAVASTRSAGDGVLDNTTLQAKGFGVYCWYTGGTRFDPAFTAPKTHIKDYAVNELMRNQKVEWKKWDGNVKSWNYTPSKYWPLNTSEKLTFRAYAPYTDYLKEDVHGMPQLPVVVKNDDYHKGTQHDPLFGTGKLLQTEDDETPGEYFPLPNPATEEALKAYYRYGSHYNNITYPMSGTYRLNKTTDPTEGTIHWYFHHGMAMLVFYAKLDENSSGTADIVSITIGPLYNQGLLSISSPATSSSDEPAWGDKNGTMNVTLYGNDDTHTQDLATYTINKDDLKLLMPLTSENQPKGLLVIPRAGYTTSSPLTITVSYRANGQINTVTTTLPNDKSSFNEFKGNKIYKMNLTVGNALVADIESVNVATTTDWNEKEGEHEVYNW